MHLKKNIFAVLLENTLIDLLSSLFNTLGEVKLLSPPLGTSNQATENIDLRGIDKLEVTSKIQMERTKYIDLQLNNLFKEIVKSE